MHADHERQWRLAPTRGRDVITITSARPPNGERLRPPYVVTRSRPYPCQVLAVSGKRLGTQIPPPATWGCHPPPENEIH